MKRNRELELLLEAEPDELRGLGTSEVARLVREKDEVRALAARILAGLGEANASLETLASRPPTPRRAGAGEHAPSGRNPGRFAGQRVRDRVPGRVSGRAVRGRGLGVAAGLALAAIALILLYAPRGGPGSKARTTEASPLSANLDAGSDRPFAVFETENPDIVVVWLFPKEEAR